MPLKGSFAIIVIITALMIDVLWVNPMAEMLCIQIIAKVTEKTKLTMKVLISPKFTSGFRFDIPSYPLVLLHIEYSLLLSSSRVYVYTFLFVALAGIACLIRVIQFLRLRVR